MRIEAMFRFHEEKKHSVRYNEEPRAGRPEVLKSLYVNKEHLPDPWPQRLRVTVEEA